MHKEDTSVIKFGATKEGVILTRGSHKTKFKKDIKVVLGELLYW